MSVIKSMCNSIISFYKSVKYHTPTELLSDQEINSIKLNGLIHFTEYENKASIEKHGILGNKKRAMRKKEKGFTWFYIYDEAQFDEKLDIVHSKGERIKYNAFAVIKELSDEQLTELRIRRKIDDAIIYPASLKTANMIVYKLPEDKCAVMRPNLLLRVLNDASQIIKRRIKRIMK